ncbi:MAG: hypothetical protein Q4F49_05010 [Pseudoxanthomonas suwonensis]|nr:hypothetical protein [Pseudoxanthomonas suwonensis]
MRFALPIAAFAAAVLVVACTADPVDTASRAPVDGAEPVAPVAPAARVAEAASSQYTSIAPGDCTLQSRDAESGAVVHRCAGVPGYALLVHDSDARMSLDLIVADGEPQPLEFWHVAGMGFSSLGSQVEWRHAPGRDVPKAMVVRFDEYEQPERPTSWLLVANVRSSASCVVAKVPPGPAQNAQARALADVVDERPCLPPPGQ